MGYLTTITIHNDALHAFKEDATLFGQALFTGINKANGDGKSVHVGFKGYCNYITVEPSRHADDETLYLHSGNTVFNLDAYGYDFEELLKRDVKTAKKFVKKAKTLIKQAEDKIKELDAQQDGIKKVGG